MHHMKSIRMLKITQVLIKSQIIKVINLCVGSPPHPQFVDLRTHLKVVRNAKWPSITLSHLLKGKINSMDGGHGGEYSSFQKEGNKSLTKGIIYRELTI